MSNVDFNFDEAPCGYVVTDRNGLIQHVNTTFLGWTRYNAADLVAFRRVQEILTPGSRFYYETEVAPEVDLRGFADDVNLDLATNGGHLVSMLASIKLMSTIGTEPATELCFVFINTSKRRVVERDLIRAQLRLERLRRLSSALAIAVTQPDVAQVSLTEILDGIKGDHGFVVLIADDTIELLAAREINIDDRVGESSFALRTTPNIKAVVQTGIPSFIENVQLHVGTSEVSSVGGQSTRLALLPLLAASVAFGVLGVGSTTKATFDADERSFLVLFAELTAQGLHVAKLHDAVATRAHQASFIAEMSHALDSAVSFQARCEQLVDLVVPELADYATVESSADGHGVIAAAHRNRNRLEMLRELRASVNVTVEQPHSLAAARESHVPQHLEHISPTMYDQYGLEPRERFMLGELAPRSYVGLPMLARGELVATLMLVMSESNRRFVESDLPHLTDIANRAALSLENARLYDHERWVAAALQRELLSRPLPQDDRVALRALYHAGGALVEIGGDYFDCFFVAPDRVAIAIGDVVGHGIPAATVMGQLRTALRAFALDGRGPVDTLDRLELFASSIEGSEFSSVAYAELDVNERELVYACAGHPPPILVSPAGQPTVLWDGRSPLLGVTQGFQRAQGRVSVEPGSTLVMYTDGLVESRKRSLDDGIAALIDLLQADPLVDLETLVEKLRSDDGHHDDVCVLTLTLI